MPPRIAKLLAVVAALAMIGVAVLVRSRIADDDEGDGGDGDPREAFTVMCITELEAICRALEPEGIEVEVEDAGTTADALADGRRPTFDAWVTIDPWPEMVDSRAAAGPNQPGLLDDAPTAVASSDLGARCLAGDDRGRLRVGLRRSRRSGEQQEIGIPVGPTAASGVQVVGEAFSSHWAPPTSSRLDFQDESSWLGQLLDFEPATDAERRMATAGHRRLHRGGHDRAAGGARCSARRAATATGRSHLGTPRGPARADVVVALGRRAAAAPTA